MLIAAILTIITTNIFATMLRTLASRLTSFVQFVITGASATMGMALNAATILNPPLPHFGNCTAATAMRYPKTEPTTSPITATNTVAFVFTRIAGRLSPMMVTILVGSGRVNTSVCKIL